MPKAIALKNGAVRQLGLTDALQIPHAGDASDPALVIGSGVGLADGGASLQLVVASTVIAEALPGGDLVLTRDLLAKSGNAEVVEVRFLDGANHVGFAAPSLTSSQIWFLPAADGNAGEVLSTDGLGSLSWQPNTGGGVTDHGALTGLADDDHTQYALLAGRTGGQILIGGTGTADSLWLRGMSGSATPNNWVFIGASGNHGYNEGTQELIFGGTRLNATAWGGSVEETLTVGYPGTSSANLRAAVHDNATITTNNLSQWSSVYSQPRIADSLQVNRIRQFAANMVLPGTGANVDTVIGFYAEGNQPGSFQNWGFYADTNVESYFGGLTTHEKGVKLVGTGTRSVTHDASTSMAAGDYTYLWKEPQGVNFVLTDMDGAGQLGWTDPASLGDNLGDHTLTENLVTGEKFLSYDGADNKGVQGQFDGTMLFPLGLKLRDNVVITRSAQFSAAGLQKNELYIFGPTAGTAGQLLTDTDGNGLLGWTDPATLQDNLGDHTLTENLKTAGFYISNDGLNSGILINGSNYVRLAQSSIGIDPLGDRQLLVQCQNVSEYGVEVRGHDGANPTGSSSYFWNDATGVVSLWMEGLGTGRIVLNPDDWSHFRGSVVVGNPTPVLNDTTFPLQAYGKAIIGGAVTPRFRMDSSGSDSRARNWEISTNTYNWTDLYFIVSPTQGTTPSTRMFTFTASGRIGVGSSRLNPGFALDCDTGVGMMRGYVVNNQALLQVTNTDYGNFTWNFYTSQQTFRFWHFDSGETGSGRDVLLLYEGGQVEVGDGPLLLRKTTDPVIDFRQAPSGGSLALIGVATHADGFVAGSVDGDYCQRIVDGSFIVSTDNGLTQALKINKTDDTVEVKQQIQVEGGNPQAGRVLTSTDANGKAVWRDFPDQAGYECNATGDLTTSNTQIPLINEIGNDRGLWTLTLGDLVAAVAIRQAVAQATVLVNLEATANNVDVEVILDWIVTTTGGTSISIRGHFPFQTSRSWSPQVTIPTRLQAFNLAAGDTIRLVGRIAAGASADASVNVGIVELETMEA